MHDSDVLFNGHSLDHVLHAHASGAQDLVDQIPQDQFSPQRAERIDWIKATLEGPEAELYAGWDNKRKRHDHSRRVTVVVVNYVVVIRLTGATTARFVTAYVADSETTINKIKRGPRWRPSGV